MLFDYNLRKGSFGNNRTNNAGSTDNSNKAGGGSKSKESNDELSSIFKEILEENNKDKISTSFFANKLKERYDIKDNAMLTKILNTIADNHDDGDGYLSLDDFEMQEKYDEISSQLYSATAGRLGTDKEKFYKILNDENLTGDDWANIIQTYENIYNRNLIDDVDADFSGITESNVRNEIMKKITSKLLESIESGSDFALEIACSELYASLKQTTNMGGKEVLDSNKADEFAINLLTGDDKINAMILSKYSQITGSNLIEDIQKNDSISKANKDLILHRLDVANTYILSEFGNNQSAFEELNLDNYPDSAKNKAWTINLLIQGLNSSLVDFQNQNNEDGSITANYNLIKALTGLGLSSQDLVSAFEEQETLIYELTKALNGESELSFEETFKKLTGVDYDEEKIIKYQELSNQYSIAYSSIQSAQMFQESVSNADNLQDVLNLFISYFGDETRGKEEFLAYLQDGMIPAQDDFDDTNQKTVAFGGYVTDISFDDNGQLVITRINNYNYKRNGEDDEIETLSYDLAETTNMIRTLPRTFDNNKFVNQVIGNIEDCFGYTINNLQEEYYNAKKEALGGADKLEETINEYCQSQSNFIDKLAGVTQVAGMVTIATGGVVTFVNPPAGVAIMGAGRYMALGGMFGDNILKAVDGLSSANGLTKDEAKALIRETLKEVGYLALGGKINSVAEAVQAGAFESLTSLGVSKGTATVLSWLAEGGTDMALSVLSDFVITGDANISGNTIQVLMGILTGVANAKVRHLKEQRIAEFEEKVASGELQPKDAASFLPDEFTPEEKLKTACKAAGIDDSDVIDVKSFAKKMGYDDTSTEIFEKLFSANIDNTTIFKIMETELSLEQCDSFIELYKSGVTYSTVIVKGLKHGWSEDHWNIYRQLVKEEPDLDFWNLFINYDWSINKLAQFKEYVVNGTRSEIIYDICFSQYQRFYGPEITRLLRSAESVEEAAKIIADRYGDSMGEFVLHGYDVLSHPADSDMVLNRYELTTKQYNFQYEVGDEFTTKAFYSTTSDLSENSWAATEWIYGLRSKFGDETSQYVKFEIHIPAGTPILTGNDVMGEVLLKYGSKFKVTGFDSDTNTYILEYIPN